MGAGAPNSGNTCEAWPSKWISLREGDPVPVPNKSFVKELRALDPFDMSALSQETSPPPPFEGGEERLKGESTEEPKTPEAKPRGRPPKQPGALKAPYNRKQKKRSAETKEPMIAEGDLKPGKEDSDQGSEDMTPSEPERVIPEESDESTEEP